MFLSQAQGQVTLVLQDSTSALPIASRKAKGQKNMNLLWSGIALAMAGDKRLAQRHILQTFWFAVGLYMNFGASVRDLYIGRHENQKVKKI